MKTRAKNNRSLKLAEKAPPEIVEHLIPQEQLELIESSAYTFSINEIAFRL